MNTLVEIIAELKSMRDATYEAELRLYGRMKEVEDTMHDVWRADYVTFDALIEEEEIGDSQRYRGYVEAVAVLGLEEIQRIASVGAAIRAARMKKPEERKKVVDHFVQSRIVNGKPVSDRQAKSVIDRLTTEKRESGYAQQAERRRTREEELSAENVQLKKQIRSLEKENREMRAELSKLRERFAQPSIAGAAKKGGARKPSPKGAEA